MLEESIPAIWASMNSWLTPTVLFVVLNLMIGTIAVASGVGGNPKQHNQEEPHQHQQQQQQHHPQLVRGPSVLQRLKSINFYRSEESESEPEPEQRHQQQAPFLQRLKSINLYPSEESEPVQRHLQQQQQQQHPQLVRGPSVLQRLKSINLYRNRSEDTNPFPQTTTTAKTITQPPPPEPETHRTQFHEAQTDEEHHHLQDDSESEEEEFFGGEQSMDEVFHRHIARTTSDTKPSSGIMPKKLPMKMKKSASTKSAFAHFEEKEIPITRPSTVRERKKTESDVQPFGDDEEVDARADDFINKFKQQLKLQRLNSIIRYKEMLNR